MSYRPVLLLFTLLVISDGAHAQDSAEVAEFHSKVDSLYSFAPHTLSSEQVEAKSAELDAFWNAVKREPKKTLPLLRVELRDTRNSTFFAYDGSKLLLSLSDTQDDRSLALEGIVRADLRDVDHTDYLRTVHWFARNGFDTTRAAFRILDYPGAEHALTLAQNYSLLCMLAPIEESLYLGPLIARLETEQDAISQQSILMTLWYSMSQTGNAAIDHFAADASKPQDSRNFAKLLLERKAPPGTPTSSTVAQIKEQRRKTMMRLSDEALGEFDRLTAEILAQQL
jgi:hypothetical protein